MNNSNSLASEGCEACRAGAPLVSASEAEELLAQLESWQLVEKNQIKMLEKTYQFNNFVSALAFTNQVGEIAEAQQHHPDILTAWGRVTVTWYTHKIKGLHRNDFRCAAKCDQLVT